MIADTDHFDALLRQFPAVMAPTLPNPCTMAVAPSGLSWIASAARQHQMHHAPPGRLPPPHRAAGGNRLAGDDLGHGFALIGGIGIHEPRHHLLVGAHVRRHHIGMRADKRDHLLHVAARQRLQLARRQGQRVDRHAAFGAAIGQTGERAFPAHPDRQRRDLAEIHRAGEARAAFGGAEREMVLHAIALKHRRAAVIAMDRHRDGHRPLRVEHAVALALRHADMIGDDVELLPRHLENRAGIDAHARSSGLPAAGANPVRAAG